MLAQLNDKTKARKSVLVDLPHAIVNEVAGNKKWKAENAHVMIDVLVKASYALTVNYKYTNWNPARIQDFQWRSPDPNAFCTCVDAWTNAKAFLSIQEHSVEQVAFSSAVHAGNSYNTDWPLYLLHHLHNFLVYFKLAVAADRNKRKSFFLEFEGFFGGTLFLWWGLKDFHWCEMFLHLQCCSF